MLAATLQIRSEEGDRRVPIDRPQFRIGRSQDNELVLDSFEVSRHHALITLEDACFVLRDHASKLGTWVNGERVAERTLAPGDRIRLGGAGGVNLVFEQGSTRVSIPHRASATSSAIVNVGHVAALLAGLRALGGSRVLDDVLALVLDAALVVSEAERGFIMLAGRSGTLEFKLARGRGGVTLPDSDFRSHRVPEDVFATGHAQYFVDFPEEVPDPDQRASVALQLGTVSCLPLVAFELVDRTTDLGRERRIGVLYLDSRKKGRLMSTATRSALEALATNAAIAIENARLYRETMEKARLEHEMRVAAEIQRLLLPRAPHAGRYCEAVGFTIPSRSIGGDFFDYLEIGGERFVFALGDVAGKGPPAALLSTLVLGILADRRRDSRSPAETVSRVNDALALRSIEARYVTLLCGQLTPDGRLAYCNAGHSLPLLVGPVGVRRLQVGGPPVGMFEAARFDEEVLVLTAGDRLIVYTDGVSEARNGADEEFGEQRIVEVAESSPDADPAGLVAALKARVQAFAAGVPQNDDITALVVAYRRTRPAGLESPQNPRIRT